MLCIPPAAPAAVAAKTESRQSGNIQKASIRRRHPGSRCSIATLPSGVTKEWASLLELLEAMRDQRLNSGRPAGRPTALAICSSSSSSSSSNRNSNGRDLQRGNTTYRGIYFPQPLAPERQHLEQWSYNLVSCFDEGGMRKSVGSGLLGSFPAVTVIRYADDFNREMAMRIYSRKYPIEKSPSFEVASLIDRLIARNIMPSCEALGGLAHSESIGRNVLNESHATDCNCGAKRSRQAAAEAEAKLSKRAREQRKMNATGTVAVVSKKSVSCRFAAGRDPVPIELTKRLEEVRLLESRRSLRLAVQEKDTDFARLADMAGDRRRQSNCIDVPFTLTQQNGGSTLNLYGDSTFLCDTEQLDSMRIGRASMFREYELPEAFVRWLDMYDHLLTPTSQATQTIIEGDGGVTQCEIYENPSITVLRKPDKVHTNTRGCIRRSRKRRPSFSQDDREYFSINDDDPMDECNAALVLMSLSCSPNSSSVHGYETILGTSSGSSTTSWSTGSTSPPLSEDGHSTPPTHHHHHELNHHHHHYHSHHGRHHQTRGGEIVRGARTTSLSTSDEGIGMEYNEDMPRKRRNVMPEGGGDGVTFRQPERMCRAAHV
ncbi:hypothetical protein AND_007208 [Anopheles darlingi]|uniref:Uncharacterized protein n=1 Tax=Anopheles darlingi TaxID=43151 RepID=W5J9J7_ANODA|nr:hypothetical protein AND_007208 [Anopheles darlingi]